MTEMMDTLNTILIKQLERESLELVGLIPLPSHHDRMVRAQTIEEILLEFDQGDPQDMKGFILQLKPMRKLAAAPPLISHASEDSEPIYTDNGKLNLPFLIKNGEVLFESGEFLLARNIYKLVLTSGEYTSLMLYRIGRCSESESDLESACANYEESLAYHPALETYQRLAALLMKQGKDQAAAQVVERALNLKELTFNQRFDLLKTGGNCWTRAKKSNEAEALFKKALELQSQADDVRSNLGALYLQDHRIAEARRHFQDAIASNPNNYQALSGLGSCFLTEGNKKAAHEHFAQSLEIELNNPNALFYLVKCAFEIKSYATAARLVSEYIQIAPISTNLLYSLAGLQFHLGRILEAEQTTQRILALQPQHAGAKDLLGMIEKYSVRPV